MSERPVVVLEGMTQMMRAFKQLESDISRDLRTELKAIARDVAAAAKVEASSKGLAAPGRSGRGTGQLVRHIRSGATQRYAYIKDDVSRASQRYPDGYNYAKVYEYGRGGVRAFLHPAVEHMTPEIVTRVDEFIAHAIRETGFHST
jgi:hypothetical protein